MNHVQHFSLGSEAMVLCRILLDYHFQLGGEILPRVKDFKYLWVKRSGDGRVVWCSVSSTEGVASDCRFAGSYTLYVYPEVTPTNCCLEYNNGFEISLGQSLKSLQYFSIFKEKHCKVHNLYSKTVSPILPQRKAVLLWILSSDYKQKHS